MIRLFQRKEDKSCGKFTTAFHSKKDFYAILGRVKSFPTKKVDRDWKVDLLDYPDLLDRLEEITQETIHLDLEIVKNHQQRLQEHSELLTLRDTLDGIDCGVKLKEPYSLLPFQHVAVEVMARIKDGLIADKVGLGKTLEGFSSAIRLRDDGVIKKSIVIASGIICDKWESDIDKFTTEDTLLLRGTPAKRKEKFMEWLKSDSLFCIVSYGVLTNDWKSYMEKVLNKDFGIICDEVQKIKNTRTDRSKTVKKLSLLPNCKSRIGLSATYVETGMQDIFGVMMVVDPSVFGVSWTSFANQYLNLDIYGKARSAKNVRLAAKKMKKVSVRRTKEDVKYQLKANLPQIIENDYWVSMTKEEKLCYNDVVDQVIEKFEDLEKADKISKAQAMNISMLLRQTCLSTEMMGYYKHVSSKLETLLEILPPIIESEKVVIFCWFTGFIDIMERELKKAGIKCITMHGKRKEGQVKNRFKYVNKFRESKDINVLLTSDILSEGADIPEATYVINMDLFWNPAKMTQRAGRIDRLVQKADTIYVINILTKSPCEMGMFDVVAERGQLALDIMDDGQTEERFKKISFSNIKDILTRKIK